MSLAPELMSDPRSEIRPLDHGAADGETLHDNGGWAKARAAVSVLIPFFRDDPCALLSSLEQQAPVLGGRVELVLLDDQGGDPALSLRVRAALAGLTLAARLVQPTRNLGRATGRNRLVHHSRAPYLLFLDSDMLPDRPDFLAAYLSHIQRARPAVVFGGFSVDQAPSSPEQALHRALASRADCLSAAVRARTPEKYVFTSNLLVRRDVFEAEAFDEAFSGWGWEDVEWGVRVGRRFGVEHIDNPATHLGLDTAAMLAAKYEQSAENFARLARRHPDVVSGYPSYRMARVLKRTPARALWRPVLKRAALHASAPMAARIAAMKLYRAALYAEVI